MLLTLKKQGDTRGVMTMPPAVTRFSVAERYIQSSIVQFIAEQAVINIDPEIFAAGLRSATLLDGLQIKTMGCSLHGMFLSGG